MEQCESCGMPLANKDDFAGGDEQSKYCKYCVGADGKVKSCEEVFMGGVEFFVGATGVNRELAQRIVRKNMRMQPHWKDSDCKMLAGEVATDDEFQSVIDSLR